MSTASCFPASSTFPACFPPEHLTGEFGAIDVGDAGEVAQPDPGLD